MGGWKGRGMKPGRRRAEISVPCVPRQPFCFPHPPRLPPNPAPQHHQTRLSAENARGGQFSPEAGLWPQNHDFAYATLLLF